MSTPRRRPLGPLDDYCDDLEEELAKVESIRDEYAFALEARLACTPAERKVLDAMAAIPDDSLHWCENISNGMDLAIAAELERRKPCDGG